MPYTPPLAEFRFLLDHVVGFDAVRATDRFAEATPETTDAVLAEAGRLCAEVLAPLRRVGDTEPARLENGQVRMPPGFRDAYAQVAEGGWIAISAAPEHGGMGLPLTLQTALNDMTAAANLGLQSCI